jgi:ribosomal protein S18 acetylase RimI-like enzyme
MPQGTLAIGGYLRLLAVVPGHERAGVGALLLDAFERALAAIGTRHAFLLVSDFNLDAQRFYTRHGYAQMGRLPALVLPDVDELVYWKRLP